MKHAAGARDPATECADSIREVKRHRVGFGPVVLDLDDEVRSGLLDADERVRGIPT